MLRSTLVRTSLVTAACALMAASPATAASKTFKTGTYKVSSSTGQTLKMLVYQCGKALCLSSAASQGAENELHLVCANTTGGGDGVSDYTDYGPERFSRTGKISESHKQADDGGTQTRTSSWTLTKKGTLTGSARLSEAFDDGQRCDSGTVTYKGRLTR